MSFLFEIMVPRHAFSEKHKNKLKYRKIFAIFGNFWANFLPHPAVGSITTFLFNIMIPRHAVSEKHKNMLKY